MGAAQFVNIVNEHDFVVLEGFQTFIFQHDDFLNHGQGIAHFQIFIELLFILDDKKARRAIHANMLNLRRRVCRVNAIGNTTTTHNRHIEEQPFFAILGNNRDNLAGLQSHLHQGCADFSRALIIIIPAKAVPNAEFFFTHGQTVAQFSAAFAEKLWQAFAAFDNG